MDSLLKEIEKRLNTIAEKNSLLYKINEIENYNNVWEILDDSVKTFKDFMKKSEKEWKKTGHYIPLGIDELVAITNLILFYEDIKEALNMEE